MHDPLYHSFIHNSRPTADRDAFWNPEGPDWHAEERVGKVFRPAEPLSEPLPPLSADYGKSPQALPSRRYALYARKSSEEDERQYQSIGSQLGHVQEVARRRGKTIVLTVEESRSAKEPGRPEFNRLLALVDAGDIDGILAWHPDRLSRNEIDAAAITWRLRKGILKDLDFAEFFFHNSPEGIMMLQNALSQSQYQVSKLSVDVTRGVRDKAKAGGFPHRAPPGYVNDKYKEKGQKTISPDPERFPLLRKAWDLLLTGTYTVPQIAQILNEQWGYRTPLRKKSRGGEPMPRTTLYRVFSNLFYAGYFLHAGTVYQGVHAPMVSLDEFYRVNEILTRQASDNKGNRRGVITGKAATAAVAAAVRLGVVPPRPRQRTRPFVGLIRCGYCGGQITSTTVTKPSGRAYIYYHCEGRNGCRKRCVREDRLEAMLDAELEQIEVLPEFYEWAIQDIEAGRAESRETERAIREQRERTLADAERQIATLTGMRMRDLITDDEFRLQRNELILQREGLRQEIAACGSEKADTARQSCLSAVEYMRNARHWLREGDVAMKRLVARSLGSNNVLREGKLFLEPHPILARVKAQYPSLKVEYHRIKHTSFGSVREKERALQAVRSGWSGMWDAVQTFCFERGIRFADVAAQIRMVKEGAEAGRYGDGQLRLF